MDGSSFNPLRLRAFRFGEFRFDRVDNTLWKKGAPVRLRQQSRALLALLLDASGKLVTLEDIRNRLWPDRTVEFAASTHACMREIRDALGDDASAPQFVATVRNRGYRFIAAVRPSYELRPDFIASPRRQIAAAVSLAIMLSVPLFWALHTPDPNIETARQNYLRAEYLLQQGDRASLERSLEFYQAAIAANASDAGFHLGQAHALYALGRSAEARRSASIAIAIDRQQLEAHLLLGRIALLSEANWILARSAFESALSIDPGNAEAHQGLAAIAALHADWPSALAHMEQAAITDPGSTLVQADYGWYAMAAGQPERALNLCREALTLAPDFGPARICAIRAAIETGHSDIATPLIGIVMRDAGAHRIQIDAVLATDTLRRFERWRLARYQDPARTDAVSAALQASLLAFLGEEDEALDQLDLSLRNGEPMLPFMLIGTEFDDLADHPRFRRIRQAAGLPAHS